MFKTKLESESKEVIVPMNKMKPCQIGIIVDKRNGYNGDYVMRTASLHTCEVMNLSTVGVDLCWTSEHCTLEVRLLNKGEKLILTVE